MAMCSLLLNARAAEEQEQQADDQQEQKEIVWYIGGDPHVASGTETQAGRPEGYFLKTAIADINELGIAERAVILGDISGQWQSDEPVKLFKKIMDEELDIPYTYVTGNWDVSGLKNLPPYWGAETIMGIRFMFLSDETGMINKSGMTYQAGLGMKDEQKKWFWHELESLQGTDTPIFLFTHQPHQDFDDWDDRFGTERALRNEIDQHNIAAWFSAHKHEWDIQRITRYGFVKCNFAAIGHGQMMGAFLYLKRIDDETVQVTLRLRDHEEKKWGAEFTFDVKAPKDAEAEVSQAE